MYEQIFSPYMPSVGTSLPAPGEGTTTVTNSTKDSIEDKYVTTNTIIGSELVETKMVEINNIPQPYIFEPSYMLITGKNFLPNTEIRIELNNTHILTPVFTDTSFEEVNFNYSGNKTILGKYSDVPSPSRQLIDPTWQDINNNNLLRPFTWKWSKDLNNMEYIITHPSPNNSRVLYKYKVQTKEWYYKYAESPDYTKLDSAPLFLKWITRSPWFNDSVEEIENEAKKKEILELHMFEPISNIYYASTYAETKSMVITDQFGYFCVLVKLPPKTIMGNHTIRCIPEISQDFDIDELLFASDNFRAESYIKNWDNQIYHRQIEEIETILYRTYVTTNTTNTHYECHTRCHNNCHSDCHNDCHSDCDTSCYCCQSHNRAHSNDHTDTPPHNRACVPDPLSQTFVLKSSMFLTGIDLYFIAKSPDLRSILFFELREVSKDGFPTGKTIYSQELKREHIQVGPTYPKTFIQFDHPVFVKKDVEYAFVIGASINGYKLLYAKMGHNDLITGEQIVYNPAVSGVMLESSNNKTWSALQDSDIKYTLYRAVFDLGPKTLYVKNINKDNFYTEQNFSTCNISIPHVIFEDTNISFEHKIAHSLNFIDDNWYDLLLEERYEFVPSIENITNMKHSIKAELSSINDAITPIINFSGFEAFYGKYKNTGSYIQIPVKLD